MLTWATQRGLVTHNPVKEVARPKARKIERFMNSRQVGELLRTIAALEARHELNAKFADIIRLLLFTGARRSEITDLRWSEVDLQRGIITLKPERHKTGAKTGSKRILLPEVAREVLARQPRVVDFVFPATGERRAKSTTGLSKAWGIVRAQSNLTEFRLHDLRHTFASFGVAQGESLYLIGKALGHSSPTMTERYAHLADDPVMASVERTANAIRSTVEVTVTVDNGKKAD
jgi:integrase